MRNELYTDKIGRTTANRVLVEVIDTFDGFITDKGIHLVNVVHEETWGDSPGYTISEFIMRFGVVRHYPDFITPGSFGYETEIEINENDIVYWNLTSFAGSQPFVMDNRKFLLIDYHELLLRIRDTVITPINGYCLFTPIGEEISFGELTIRKEKTIKWKLYLKPELLITPLKDRNYIDDIWEIGDIVYLSVMDKPFQIEGKIYRELPEVLYAAPMNMILCEA